MPAPDPVWAREYRDTLQAERLRREKRDRRRHLRSLPLAVKANCVYCGGPGAGFPVVCAGHDDLPPVDPNFGAL